MGEAVTREPCLYHPKLGASVKAEIVTMPIQDRWHEWIYEPPPYGTRSVEAKRLNSDRVFPLDPTELHPTYNIAGLLWRNAL